jgi:predicted dienelactone hydrolase
MAGWLAGPLAATLLAWSAMPVVALTGALTGTLTVAPVVAPVVAAVVDRAVPDPASALAAPARTGAPNPAVTPSAANLPLFAVHDLDWLDARRQRAVPVRLYLPAAASGVKPVPLIVFSHGIGGSRNGYSYLGRFWASQGYASLHLQHVGSDRALWSGNPFGMVGRLQAAAQDGEATARVQDLSFALDQVLAGEFASRLDGGRVVAAGHSYGANTTLLAVGAQVQRAGRLIDLRDPRVKAAIVISAPPFYGETEFGAILGAIAVPSLHVTATEDTIDVPGYFSPFNDRVSVFEATGGPAKMLAVFEGGSHNIFSDRSLTGGAALNPLVKAATQALSLAFLKSVFDGDSQGLRDWTVQFASLLARSNIDRR